jgi:hypothetical protein
MAEYTGKMPNGRRELLTIFLAVSDLAVDGSTFQTVFRSLTLKPMPRNFSAILKC